MNSFDLTPLFRSSVGFDRFSDLLDTAFKLDERAPSYPPYNIEKLNDDEYRVTVALAGFKPEDLDIVAQENTLTISGSQQETEEEKGKTYLHRGIATRSFQRSFQLADHVKVKGAKFADGMLQVDLVREVPEEVKPRSIAIETSDGKKVTRRIDMKKAS